MKNLFGKNGLCTTILLQGVHVWTEGLEHHQLLSLKICYWAWLANAKLPWLLPSDTAKCCHGYRGSTFADLTAWLNGSTQVEPFITIDAIASRAICDIESVYNDDHH